jgi:L-amino acid N-acyltransferase YncA
MSTGRNDAMSLQLPMLNYDEGSPEQVAQRLAAHQISYEIERLEDEGRATGWASVHRVRALEVAKHLRMEALRLFELGTRGLEARAAYETARLKGFPCEKCGHRHEGSRYSFRCFSCTCAEARPPEVVEASLQRPTNPRPSQPK